MVMRAVHVASAPGTGRMLLHLCAQPRSSAELSRLTARPRLVSWEEISDLVQAGLVERDLEHDLVRPTPAGLALADLIGEMTDALSIQVTR
jgi:DNA-binding IclR family transcriptional regulator